VMYSTHCLISDCTYASCLHYCAQPLLQVAAVGFLKACVAHDGASYSSYLLEKQLLDPVVAALRTTFNTSCLLRTTILELLTFIRYVIASRFCEYMTAMTATAI
jgi:hypothetical protein